MDTTGYSTSLTLPKLWDGNYCRLQSVGPYNVGDRCDPYPVCEELHGQNSTTYKCMCAKTLCEPGEYCANGQCISYGGNVITGTWTGGSLVASGFVGPLCIHTNGEVECICGSTYNVCEYSALTAPYTWGNEITGTGVKCTFETSDCSRPATCGNTNGTTLNSNLTCSCGVVDCWSQTGMYCFEEENMCSDTPVCDNKDGTIVNSECICKLETCGPDKYCSRVEHVEGSTPIGCYNFVSGTTTAAFFSYLGEQFSIETCQQEAVAHGYKYFVLRNSVSFSSTEHCQPTLTEEECRSAAENEGYTFKGAFVTSNNFPKGCYKRKDYCAWQGYTGSQTGGVYYNPGGQGPNCHEAEMQFMTRNINTNLCKDNHYGVNTEYASGCFCGADCFGWNSFTEARKEGASTCSALSTDNNHQVYLSDSSYYYVDLYCYPDKTLLPSVINYGLERDDCFEQAGQQGFKYFGLVEGQCRGGNQLEPILKSGQVECSTTNVHMYSSRNCQNCTTQMCRDYSKCELDKELTTSCLCGDDTCSTGQYCNKGICQDSPKCEFTDGIILNSASCMCGINECSSDEYCHQDIFDVCSSAHKCDHQLGSVANSENCWCNVTSPTDTSFVKHLEDFIYCDNQPYCQSTQPGHERCDIRADTYPITTDNIIFDYVTRCQDSFTKNTEKCFCYGLTGCPASEYCIDNQYCNKDIKCRFNDGIQVHKPEVNCMCSIGNQCSSGSGEACFNDGRCDNPKCASGGSGSTLTSAGCKCFDGTELLDTCSSTEYCYNPPDVPAPIAGCVNEPIKKCFENLGDNPNTNLCLCGTNMAKRVFCTDGQYCNDKLHMCSDDPNPTCKNNLGGESTNGDTSCLCVDENDDSVIVELSDICQPYELCDITVPKEQKCHAQYCKDYVYGETQLCNVFDTVEESRKVGLELQIFERVVTYGNGLVSPLQECTTSDDGICKVESFKECCKECPSNQIHILGTGMCQSNCDYTICTDGWIKPPAIGSRISYSTSKWDETEIQQRLNFKWTGYCSKASCDNYDLETCCVKAQTCPIGQELTLCNQYYHTRNYKTSTMCNNFECSTKECCEVRRCTCTGGVPKQAFSGACTGNGNEECDSCFSDHWKTANDTCSPIIECKTTQYETVPPIPFTRNRECEDLTVCQGDEYIVTNATIRAADPGSPYVIFHQSVADSDHTCKDRTICNYETEYQTFRPNLYQNRDCSTLTPCGPDQYANPASLVGQLWTSDSECQNKRVCQSHQYIVSNGTTVSDRICSTIDPQCVSPKVETQTPINGTRNRFCQTPRDCESYEYETQAPTDTQNRECAPITNCSETQFETRPPNATSDRVCTKITDCLENQYISSANTATTDRQCSNITVCDPNKNQYETQEPNATFDRICDNCTDCVGCMQETDCTFDMSAKISYLTVSENTGGRTCSGHICVHYKVEGTNEAVIFEPDKGRLEYGNYYRFSVANNITFTVKGVNLFKGRTESGTEASITKNEYLYFQIPMKQTTQITYKPGNAGMIAFLIKRDCQQRETYVGSGSGSKPVCTSVCGAPGAVLMKRITTHTRIGGGIPCLPTLTSTPCVCVEKCPDGYADNIDTFLKSPVVYKGACFYENCKCPIDCKYTVNDDFEPCDAACGEVGSKIKKINITVAAAHKGFPCPMYGAKASCTGDYEMNKCDCDGNVMDRCGICGGKNKCVGCDDLAVLPDGNAILPDGRKVPGYRKKVADRCGVCDGNGSTCAVKFKLMTENKKATSQTLKIALPVIIAVVVISIFITLFTCLYCDCQFTGGRNLPLVNLTRGEKTRGTRGEKSNNVQKMQNLKF